MINTTYKYVKFGEKFDHEGVTYIKYNFSRGYYMDGLNKIFKKFNKRSKVVAHKKFYDVEGKV